MGGAGGAEELSSGLSLPNSRELKMLPGNKTDLLGIFWEFVNVHFCSRWSADTNGHLSEQLGGVRRLKG